MAASAITAEAAAPQSWTGGYCGAGVGADAAAFHIDNTIYYPGGAEHTGSEYGAIPNSSDDDAWTPIDIAPSGALVTAICGADLQAGAFVLGGFGDVDLQNKTGEFEVSHESVWHYGPSDYNYNFQGQRWDVGLGTMGTVGARAGVLLNSNLLVFGVAGWSWAQASLGYFGGCDRAYAPSLNCGDIVGSSDTVVGGPTVGAGVEALFGDRVSTRVEYRYTNLGSMTTNSAAVSDSPYPGWTGSSTAAIIDQSVRFSLVYRP